MSVTVPWPVAGIVDGCTGVRLVGTLAEGVRRGAGGDARQASLQV